MNSFKQFFMVFAKSLSNLFDNFWEDCFRKPKLLLAANKLTYLNISISISKIHGPQPPHADGTTSGVKIRPVLKK